jgi:multidrug efflux system membrane fusion protein
MKRLMGLLAAAVLAGCGKTDGKKPAARPSAPPVEVALVERRTMPVERSAIGLVEPMATVQVKSKVQGEILRVHFADGAMVKAGDRLFSIDPRSFDAALRRAEANLAVTRTGAVNAAEQAQRYTTLIERGVASKEQTAQILTTAEAQQSELAARQADVDAARLSLEWTNVLSPIDGRIGAALLTAGNIVQPNGETLAVINQVQPIYVAFSLPESSLKEVRERLKTVRPMVTATDPASGRTLGEGELTFIDNAVDRQSGMIGFKATFPNTDESLWPGQFVDVTLTLAEEPDAIVVPAPAVMEGQTGAQVFVVRDDTAELRKVTVSRVTEGLAVIREGLEPGEAVIVTGQLRVNPGGRVTVKGKTP